MGFLILGSTAQALTITGSVGGAPTGVSYLNFDDLSNGDTGSLFTSGPSGAVLLQINPNAKVAVGAQSGQYAPPWLSGSNGVGFASQNTAGADTTPYLTSGRTGDGGSIKLTFASDMNYFGLLWGSVDSYNKLEFFNAANLSVGVVTGSMVTASPNGNQGVNGTLYVNIDNIASYRSVVATSSSFAFEFDNVAYGARGVPDGASTVGLMGLGLAGLAFLRRRTA